MTSLTPPKVAGLRLAAAQTVSVGGDVAGNLERHLAAIACARSVAVQWLVFPELSLTGYEPELLAHCVWTSECAAQHRLSQAAREVGMFLTVGAPVTPEEDGATHPAIGALTFCPDGTVHLYRKHHLHPSEEVFASAGRAQGANLCVAGKSAALAICADVGHASHAQRAARSGARYYAAGVLESPKGYDHDALALATYAQQWDMVTLMANHGGASGPYQSAGKSALWDASGMRQQAPAAGAYVVWAAWDGGGGYQDGGVVAVYD